MFNSVYAKAIVAAVGSAVTAALALVPPETTTWQVLTVVAAVITTLSVYLVPNKSSV